MSLKYLSSSSVGRFCISALSSIKSIFSFCIVNGDGINGVWFGIIGVDGCSIKFRNDTSLFGMDIKYDSSEERNFCRDFIQFSLFPFNRCFVDSRILYWIDRIAIEISESIPKKRSDCSTFLSRSPSHSSGVEYKFFRNLSNIEKILYSSTSGGSNNLIYDDTASPTGEFNALWKYTTHKEQRGVSIWNMIWNK